MQHLHLLDAEAAQNELAKKSIGQIERETAITWGGRAAAAYANAKQSSGNRREQWLKDAENYRQESLEHAAMTEDMGLLSNILDELKAARAGT